MWDIVQTAFSQALVQGLGRAPGESEGLGTGTPGVTFTTSPGPCKNWLLAATQYVSKPNAIVEGSTLDFGSLFLKIMRMAGAGLQYFTYEGHLYKYWYTGFDEKTGKYNQGSQYKNTVYVCTDGMSILKNPDSSSEYLLVPSSSGGLVLHVHESPSEYYRPRLFEGEGEGKRELSMETAFNVRGLGRTPVGNHAFNPTLLHAVGLGITPKKSKPITPAPKPKPAPTPKLPVHLVHGSPSPSPPVLTTPISVTVSSGVTPAVPGPIVLPSTSASTTAPATPLPYIPQPGAIQVPALVAAPVTPTIPTVAYVMLGILGVGVVGGLAYIILE
jgi:hypothetical protein